MHSLLIVATNHSKIRAVEYFSNLINESLRTMKEIWLLSCMHKYGEITAMLPNKRSCWLLVGTSRGVLMLWDTRFLICLKIWTHPFKGRIWKLATCVHDAGKLVLIAGENEISLWDISTAECQQVWCSIKSNTKEDCLENIPSELYSNGFEVLLFNILTNSSIKGHLQQSLISRLHQMIFIHIGILLRLLKMSLFLLRPIQM